MMSKKEFAKKVRGEAKAIAKTIHQKLKIEFQGYNFRVRTDSEIGHPCIAVTLKCVPSYLCVQKGQLSEVAKIDIKRVETLLSKYRIKKPKNEAEGYFFMKICTDSYSSTRFYHVGD
ncbi:MAG: hypothetical protein K0R24_2108 [Gammaproteobacteria bacterium]|jgi:hypothetical protein|nr:hypothetical protein [Gammaproteobacteria bacterium]